MAYIDDLNAELGLEGDIGSEKERESALEAADLPSLIPTADLEKSAFAPPLEAPTAVPTGIVRKPSISKPSTTGKPTSIYETTRRTLGMPSAIEAANIEIGITPPSIQPTLPSAIKTSSIDEANRMIGYGPETKIGETRSTQGPSFLIPTTHKDIPIHKEPEKAPSPFLGPVGELVRGLYTGVTKETPLMFEQAGKFLGLPTEVVGEVAKPTEPTEAVSAFEQAGRMLPPSFGIPALTALAGGALGFALGGPPGAALGALAARFIPAAIFGLAQAQQTKENAISQGVDPGLAPYAAGTIEAVGEYFGTKYLTRLLKPLAPVVGSGIKNVVYPTLGRLIRELPKTLLVETSTEFGQQFGEAGVEKLYGIRPEAKPLKEAFSVLAPTTIMTILSAGMAHPLNKYVSAPKTELHLNPIKVNRFDRNVMDARMRTVTELAGLIQDMNPQIATLWFEQSMRNVAMGEDVDLNQKLSIEALSKIINEPSPPIEQFVKPQGVDVLWKETVFTTPVEQPVPEGAPAVVPTKDAWESAYDLLTQRIQPEETQVLGAPTTAAETPPPQPLGAPALAIPKESKKAWEEAYNLLTQPDKPLGELTRVIPRVEGLVFNGIQKIPDEPDQYVFTDEQTQGTFYTKNITKENLIRQRNRMRRKFAAPPITEAIDKNLSFDILRSIKKTPAIEPITAPEVTPITPVTTKPKTLTSEQASLKYGREAVNAFLTMEHGEFIRQAGAMKFGDKGFTLARDIEEQDVKIIKEAIPNIRIAPENRGIAFVGGQQRYFADYQEIKEGKNKGKIRITPTRGKVITIDTDDIIRYPKIREERTIPGFARHTVFDTDGTISLRIGSVEQIVTHRTGKYGMMIGAVPGLIGEVWVDANTNQVYSLSMYDRKLRGEDVTGIPFDKLEGIPIEGWKAVIHQIDPQFEISERIPVQPIRRQPGMTVDQLGQIVQDLKLKIPENAVNLEILNSTSDIPKSMIASMRRGAPNPLSVGLFIRSVPIPTVYLFADNIRDENHAVTTIFHELVGHLGFERMVGPGRLRAFTNMVIDLYGLENLGYLYRAYGATPGTKEGDYRVALEKVAELAQSGENPGLWTRFVVWFRETVANIFGSRFAGQLTEDEIKVYLWRSRELLEQENIPNMEAVYNSMTKLISMRMWDTSLPDGPINFGFQARMDSSPSHDSAADNFAGWRSWFEGIRRGKPEIDPSLRIPKQLGIVEAIASLPHWVAMRFPSFKPVTEVEWIRHDNRNRDRLYLLSESGINSGDNPYIDKKALGETRAVDKLLIWSDQNDYYLEGDTELNAKSVELNGHPLNEAERKAYRGWKGAFDRAIDYAVDKLRKNAMKVFSDRLWAEELNGVINGTIDPATITLEPDQAKEFNRAVQLTKERLARVDKLEAGLREMNFYVPHVRGKGDYVVRVSDVGSEGQDVRIWAERFNTAQEAQSGLIRLRSEYPDLKVEGAHDPKTTEFIYGQMNIPAMEAFLEKAAGRITGMNQDEVNKLLDSVYKAIDEEIMARGFRQAYMHRHRGRVIGGYRTEDLRTVFFDYMSGLAGSMTKLDASFDFHKALQAIDKVNERGLYEYAVKYVNDMLRNTDALDRKLNALKTLPYAWYLSMNLRLALTQMFQNAVTAYPILARLQQEAGIKGSAALRLERAMQDITNQAIGRKHNITEEQLRMLQDAYEEGETLANYIQAIKGKVEGGWAKTYFMKLLDAVSLPFAGMERFNRRTSLLAAFRMYREAGMSYDEAFLGAKEFVRSAHYAYGVSNFPQLLRDGTPLSKIVGMGYVFKSFPHNYVLSMLHFAKDKEGRLALGVLMRSLAMIALLGGLTALPFVDDILEEYEQIFGDPVRSSMRNTLRKYGGDALAHVGMEGLPALVYVDMSGSVKMQIPLPGVGRFDPNTFTMGVWGGLIDKGKKSFDFAVNGQFGRAIEAGAPTGIEMILKSARLKQEGLRTAAERRILGKSGEPIVPTPYETAAQIAGFRPERFAEIQKERRVAQNIQEKFSKQRSDIKKRLRTAGPEDMESIRKAIEKYNLQTMKYAGIIPRLDIRSTFRPETGYMKYERWEENQ